MAFNTLKVENFLRRVSAASIKKYATASEAVQVQEEPPVHFRTAESNPVNHTTQHQERFYTIPNDVYKKLYSGGGLPKEFMKQVKTFNECCFLTRSPTIEILSYLRNTNYNKPVNRYVLYGPSGCGKTLSMAHILHYGLATQKVLIHIPWAPNWFRHPKEVANSTTREGYVDLPIDAAAWLIHFKNQNSQLLEQLKLTTDKEYTWSLRESTPRGVPLMQLVDLGINRVRYASEIIIALTSELKEASIAGKCQTLVMIDGYNIFFTDRTRVFTDAKAMVLPDKVSLTIAALEMTKYDWCNGAVVVSVDQLAVGGKKESDLPRLLLGKAGFEHLDPFMPVSVNPYTDSEFYNVMDYFKDRRWVRNCDEEGLQELKLLSAKNGFKLMNLCAAL
ncbi:28S ribosomal protein S29, mitochondrial [Neodiprion virginianus]|uniref:28S ribosomal protein S29, mitochondrial n=1 Tax=Neodiprion virginianus TaxID=2961670 RepID=UPI001EE69FBA|nr:28S ribosomal protein S29, mitochondrial [Neodiprion virginianus]